jgi:hypothetical protein
VAETLLTKAQASRMLGRPARTIADLVYSGKVSDAGWPLVRGRKMVPVSVLPEILKVLEDRPVAAAGVGG